MSSFFVPAEGSGFSGLRETSFPVDAALPTINRKWQLAFSDPHFLVSRVTSRALS